MTRTRRNAGFSLVEVMFAILILGIALVGFTQGITTALSSTKESELQTTAALIAAGQIEELRAGGLIADGTTDGPCGSGLSLYRWKQTITSTSTDGLHEVSVVIEHAKTGQTICELNTLLFEPPASPNRSEPSGRNSPSKSRQPEGRK